MIQSEPEVNLVAPRNQYTPSQDDAAHAVVSKFSQPVYTEIIAKRKWTLYLEVDTITQ